jgi:hypothetical protein
MPILTRAQRANAITRGVFIVGAMLAGMAGAVAETPEQRQACTDDAFRLCSDAMPDRERVFSCLAARAAMLSPLCREGMAPYLPPEPPPVVQQIRRSPPKAHTKADTKAKTATKAETKSAAKTKSGTKAPGAPLSLSPKVP